MKRRRALRWIATAGGVVLALVGVLLLYAAVVPLPRYAVPSGANATPSTTARVERGRRIASMRCFDCHIDPATGRANGRRLTAIPSIMGTSVAGNLTSDRETGLGGYSDAELVHLLRTGVARDGRLLPPWMPPLRGMDRVAAGLYVVQSLAACWTCHSGSFSKLDHSQPSLPGATSPQEAVYRKYGCNACHGLDGVGNADLRRATEHYPSDVELEAWIRHPSRRKPGTRMPDYDGVIAAEDFPRLLQHVRTLSLPDRR